MFPEVLKIITCDKISLFMKLKQKYNKFIKDLNIKMPLQWHAQKLIPKHLLFHNN